MDQSVEVLLYLLRVALGKENKDYSLPNDVDWHEIFVLSIKQGIVNIVYDGLQKLIDDYGIVSYGFDSPNLESLRYKWIGYGLCADKNYRHYIDVISELADFYNRHECKMILLKGYGLSVYYPFPSHRPTGDIDIAVITKEGEYVQRRADEILQKELGLIVTKSNLGHHSHFKFQNQLVENHYEFSNTYMGGEKSQKFENLLQSICIEGLHETIIGCSSIYLPSPTFNALFLMWHLATHFRNSQISLRQLCDWGLFLQKEYYNIDWELVKQTYYEQRMDKFAQVVDGILVDYLGMEKCVYGELKSVDSSVKKILDDVFSPYQHSSFLQRICRYPQVKWKYGLFYSHWIRPLVHSAIIHLFCKDDLIEAKLE